MVNEPDALFIDVLVTKPGAHVRDPDAPTCAAANCDRDLRHPYELEHEVCFTHLDLIRTEWATDGTGHLGQCRNGHPVSWADVECPRNCFDPVRPRIIHEWLGRVR